MRPLRFCCNRVLCPARGLISMLVLEAAVRILATVVTMALVAGCRLTPPQRYSREDVLQSWFQRRVNPEAARYHFLNATDRAAQKASLCIEVEILR